MPLFNDITEVKKFINVSRNLDIKLLAPYESSALDKIYEFIPQNLFSEIESNHQSVMTEIKRATANYMIAFAIPFLKVHLSNIGGNNFEDDKMKKADWWDMRDYGLSAVRIADKALSKAINLLLGTNLKEQLKLDTSEDSIFKTPEDFEEIYPIGNSWDVFKKIKTQISYVWKVYLQHRLGNCSLAALSETAETAEILKSIIGFYTISEIISDPTYLFTSSGIVLQWEELPWQKSKVIEPKVLETHGQKYLKKANELFDLLLGIIKNNPNDFPCYQEQKPQVREVIVKKSGLYL